METQLDAFAIITADTKQPDPEEIKAKGQVIATWRHPLISSDPHLVRS
jgi:hypothetical protein